MKHTIKVTLFLIGLFVVAQLLGLIITNQYMDYEKTKETGNATYKSLPMGMERPEVEESYSYIYILVGVFIGTMILLLLIKFKQTNLWKLWYFLAVLLSLTVAFAAFINRWIALFLALLIATFKIWKPNIIVHNVSEILIYGGLAAIFVPIMNTISAVILLVIISLYDMYAVWKSKHMVKMAKFQTKSKLFAGLSIPYSRKEEISSSTKGVPWYNARKLIDSCRSIFASTEKPVRGLSDTNYRASKGERKEDEKQIAILGGGDIAFPLLFTAVIMKAMIIDGFSRNLSFVYVLIITIMTTFALSWLLFASKRGKFYPAMPFISIGCFLGYGILWLLTGVF